MNMQATTAAAAWATLPPMSMGWKTKVLEDAGGDLLQFEGINRRGTAAAVFPLTLHVYSAKYCNTCARSD